ncbi:MAG: 3-deoxy-manno-octulosonate cytidylyltransferase [Flavobacteriales bacterium]|nr:3-deoxy-manno-octulosonate cytidylyltransferase [Flavobacteriales bacterium]
MQKSNMKIIAVIPARYKSTRLTNKPLIQIHNKPLIQLTYEAVVNTNLFDSIYITTDAKKIQTISESFGATCILTSTENRNGTERCVELIQKIDESVSDNDIIINIQCDEPFIQKRHIKKLINLFKDDVIGTLITPLKTSEITDQSIVKTIVTGDLEAIDFARTNKNWPKTKKLFKHIGVYAYTKKALLKLKKLTVTQREITESLEQLRWLKYKYIIKCAIINESLISINTKNDLKKVLKKN